MNKLLKTCKVGVFCYYLTLVWAFSLYPRDELTLGGRQEGRELRNTEQLKSVGFGLRPVFECHPQHLMCDFGQDTDLLSFNLICKIGVIIITTVKMRGSAIIFQASVYLKEGIPKGKGKHDIQFFQGSFLKNPGY